MIFTAGIAIGMERPNDTPILVQEGDPTASGERRGTRATSTAAVLGTRTATTAPAAPARPRVRPISAGYVWGRGSFLATGAANRVERFELATACGTSLVVPPMTVGANASFRFRGRLRSAGGGRYAVEVTGRWISPDAVRGKVRYSARTCRQRSVAYVARPSCQPLERCSQREDGDAVRP